MLDLSMAELRHLMHLYAAAHPNLLDAEYASMWDKMFQELKRLEKEHRDAADRELTAATIRRKIALLIGWDFTLREGVRLARQAKRQGRITGEQMDELIGFATERSDEQFRMYSER
jgi:hypothetical protein